jgi:histidine triad (HIT) family protein
MCVFCEIIAGNIPCHKLYEDEKIIVFLDISKLTRGHCLVVPKKHYDDITKLPISLSGHIFKVATKISKVLIKDFKFKGVNLLTNNKEIAGQEVKHFHLHIIPRESKDELQLIHSNSELNDTDIELANKIKDKLYQGEK